MRRRELLRRGGAAAVAAPAAALTLTQHASAEHPDSQPPYVSLTYDESLINQYQPLLLLHGVEERPQAFHAVYCESAESDLDVVVGFHYYLTQKGASTQDSHLGDREPVYVYVDSATGEPVKVQYSAFHWYENTAHWDDIQADGSGKRPYLRVVPKHHHHRTYDGFVDSDEATDLPLRNLLESYPGWLDNGLEDEIHPGVVYNPQEEMQHRQYWWADGVQTFQERLLAQIYLAAGVRGADKSDVEGWL